MLIPHRHLLSFALASCCFLAPGLARAETEDEQRAARWFETGRALARAGRCADAIPILLESVKAAPGVGALLNLGLCHAEAGATLTAYRYYVRADELARARGDDRAADAEQQIHALEPRLSELTVRVADPSEPGLALRLDNEPLDRPQWSVARRVDPGVHVLSASSPARGTVTLRVTVGSNADHSEIVLAPLARPTPPNERTTTTSTQRTVGWVIGGTGAAAIAAGAVFGVLSALDHSNVVDQCPSYPRCPSSRRAEAEDLNDSARTKGTVSTIALSAGLALAIGGAVLIFTAPRSSGFTGIALPARAARNTP